MVDLVIFKGDYQAHNTYPTKAEFIATMTQLYGDRATYTDMYGKPVDPQDQPDGRLYLDGKYVGFWSKGV